MEYNYVYSGDTVIAITRDNSSDVFNFICDENGDYIGFTYGTGTYYYIRNLQNDVVAIVDANQNILVTYSYDPWGNCTTSGALASTIGDINPIRYRGYFYDTESELYYLQSRYYDPQTCRFINADGYVSTGQGTLGYNMYAYCNNNPIMYSDPSGCLGVFSLVAACVAICVASIFAVSKLKPNDYRVDKTMNRNCYTYAFDLVGYADPGDYSHNSNNSRFRNDEVYSVDEVAELVMRDMNYFGKSTRIVSSPVEKNDNETIVAMKVTNTLDGDAFDYHFAVQLKNGKWADKPSIFSSRYDKIDGAAIKWELNEYKVYDSETVYFAVGD